MRQSACGELQTSSPRHTFDASCEYKAPTSALHHITLSPQKKGDKMEKAFLKTKGGKYLQVRQNTRNEVKLYALDLQGNRKGTDVCILTREINQRKQMAFQFHYNHGLYSPKVDGENIKMEKVSVAEMLDCHWFEKVNQGSAEHYSLKTVVETPQYLAMNTGGSSSEKHLLSLTHEPLQCLYITIEKE
ncbi:uncharacterized protein LOC124877492 isoform X2 [Girardinichthys multiradiatus]|uniref:uncharacterized protein LOC124877492 isoform X2 n=1 Tax=Girardinichthys multiradiatus TaxID=208333 RepID=UPI001FADF9AE|nr:uncharacterized protein LOC124877492 isoform X2 [Girardinichthys multiradiatus]